MSNIKRCSWCDKDDMYRNYHDEIWGKPNYDSKDLFIKLCLDGMQAGLSWHTILLKTQGYMTAFDNWDIDKIAMYDEKKVEELMNDKNIIRNRLKINAIIQNAKAYQKIDDFSKFIWSYVNYEPKINYIKDESEAIIYDDIALLMSKDLKKLGFKFVGPTICYAFMQAVGLVNDHYTYCSLHPDNIK